MNRLPASALAAALLLLAGCKVGPDYARPDAPGAAKFKELAGWKPSTPRDGFDRGAWWSVYNDPGLDRLERQIAIDNQTVKAAEAAYRQATALVRGAQATILPTVVLAPSITRGTLSGTSASGVRAVGSTASVEPSASWDLDVWGKIRRQIESQSAAAQVSAADLANAKLSAQAALATAYFELRAADSLALLLQDTLVEYRRALAIAQNQYDAGVASRADVLAADVQVQSAQAQLVAAGEVRAQYEHAIAVLTGHPPADLALPAAPLAAEVPVVPAGVPSTLLERRPDIAAAERTMQEQNALIGVAVAAWYPEISLSGAIGLAGNPMSNLFAAANRVWSLGAAASETLFDAGARSAAIEAARAAYDGAVANYRQTVLTAFQQVEDDLSDLRVLQDQARAEEATVAAARRAVDVTLNEYRAGTVAYTSVITEQTQLLSAQQTALTVQQNRFVASVALIQALGGGWDVGQLPPSASDLPRLP